MSTLMPRTIRPNIVGSPTSKQENTTCLRGCPQPTSSSATHARPWTHPERSRWCRKQPTNRKYDMTTPALKAYFKRLGLPGNWERAPEAITLLRERRLPVSPATQELIRQFGGLNTSSNPPPPCPPGTGSQHGPPLFEIDPRGVLDEGECVKEMEADFGVRNLCPIGYSYEGLGLMCADEAGTIWFWEGASYSGVTPEEVIENLLTGHPNASRIP